MVKIIDKLNANLVSNPNGTFFSYEFFPPKTDAGLENLYNRIERMISLEPLFIDVTWGAGGSTRSLSMAISEYSIRYLGVDAMMHLTCTNLTVTQIIEILNSAKDCGIRNILALRGEMPKAYVWEPVAGGLNHAIDLVKLIRDNFGDYFCIAVAGFPEGHPHSNNHTDEIKYLKAKVDAGADFILTQFFYDIDAFLEYVNKCKLEGIMCPIIPGMMPIQSFSSFQKMTNFCKTKVPQHIWDSLYPIRENDEEVKAYGINLCIDMCKKLQACKFPYFHFYTLNLEKSVLSILRSLGVLETTACRRALPWRGSRSNINGMVEDVRPINWANRPKSYIQRTETWDEYPNGRWGDGRSPAFGELSNYHFYKALGSRDERLAMWGESPINCQDIFEIFARYVEGKVPVLPWCESSLQSETTTISTDLARINRLGFLTINSQPAVNGEKSDHPLYGWGGPGGRVYQKAYVEFFVSPDLLDILIEVVNLKPNLTLHAVNQSKDVVKSSNLTGFNSSFTASAVTWGVFPNREIIQPTVFDHEVFLIWSTEAFQLWLSFWASLYDDETDSSELIYNIHDTFYLVAIIDNEFINSELFDIFDEVIDMSKSKKFKNDY